MKIKRSKNIKDLTRIELMALAASEKSFINIEAVNNSEKCGCYHCISVFESSEITEWCDGEKTALCPSCGIDSVIPNETDINVLTTIWKHWFAWPDE